MNENKRRIISIACDAAEVTLIENWVSEGKLPHIGQLMKNGYWNRLKSTADVASGGTWPSVITGCSPAVHGIARSHRHLKTGTYEVHKQYANQVKQPPFWDILSEKGLRSAIIDIPKSYPKNTHNGIHLVNWGDEHQSWKQSSVPVSFKDEVIDKFGKHPLEGWYHEKPKNKKQFDALISKLMIGIKTRTELGLYVLDKEPWDFFMISYAELHWAGHVLWHTYDKNHPEWNTKIEADYGNTMLKLYQEIDKGIGSIRSRNTEALFMFFSNSGMGPNYSGRHLVTPVLQNLGLAPKNESKRKSLKRFLPAQRWGAQTFEQIERFIPKTLIKKLKLFLPETFWDKYTRKLLYGGNNWNECLAFSIPSDYSGTIRINLEGREPEGKITIGKEYDDICELIKSEFLSLINPKNGNKIVREVIKVREEYSGPFIDELPDIVIIWNRETVIDIIESPKYGIIENTLKDKRTGGHESYGCLLIQNSESQNNSPTEDGHILDIAATIIKYLTYSIPDHFEGKPIKL